MTASNQSARLDKWCNQHTHVKDPHTHQASCRGRRQFASPKAWLQDDPERLARFPTTQSSAWERGAAMRLGGAPPAARAASGGGLRLRSAAPGLPALARSLQLRQAGRQLALDVQARDGKKRRKPQQRGSMDSSSSDDEAAARPAPRRVVTDSLIPVRLQQKCVGWAPGCCRLRGAALVAGPACRPCLRLRRHGSGRMLPSPPASHALLNPNCVALPLHSNTSTCLPCAGLPS